MNKFTEELANLQKAVDLISSTLDWCEVTKNHEMTLDERISLHAALLKAEQEELDAEFQCSNPWYKEYADVLFVECQYRFLCDYHGARSIVDNLLSDKKLLKAFEAVVADNWTKVLNAESLYLYLREGYDGMVLHQKCQQIQEREDKKNPGRYTGIHYEMVKSESTGKEYIVFKDSTGKVLKPMSYDGHHVAEYTKQ